jgi:hypothetical protein
MIDIRTKLLPIDVDWTMDMVDDISGVILRNKKQVTDIGVTPLAIEVVSIVQKHLDKNDYELRIKADD